MLCVAFQEIFTGVMYMLEVFGPADRKRSETSISVPLTVLALVIA